MNYAQRANAEITRANDALKDAAEAGALAENAKQTSLTYAQIHATLAVAFATLAVQAEVAG